MKIATECPGYLKIVVASRAEWVGCFVEDNLVLFSLRNRLAALDNEMFKLRSAGSELVASNRICGGGSTVAGIAV